MNLIRRQPVDVLTVQLQTAGVPLHHTADQVEERRLPGSVGADDAEHLTAVDLDVDVLQGLDAAERAAEAVALENRTIPDRDAGGRRLGHLLVLVLRSPPTQQPPLPLSKVESRALLNDAVGQEADDQQHQEAEREHPQRRIVLHERLIGGPFLEQDPDHGPDHRPPHRPGAAEDDQRKHQEVVLQGKAVRIYELLGVGEEDTDGAGEVGAAGVGEQLVPVGVDAHALGDHLILPDRHPGPPDVRGDHSIDGNQYDGRYRESDVVEVEGIEQPRAGDLDRGHVADSDRAVGEPGPVDRDQAHHLAEGEGHDRQIVASRS